MDTAAWEKLWKSWVGVRSVAIEYALERAGAKDRACYVVEARDGNNRGLWTTSLSKPKTPGLRATHAAYPNGSVIPLRQGDDN